MPLRPRAALLFLTACASGRRAAGANFPSADAAATTRLNAPSRAPTPTAAARIARGAIERPRTALGRCARSERRPQARPRDDVRRLGRDGRDDGAPERGLHDELAQQRRAARAESRGDERRAVAATRLVRRWPLDTSGGGADVVRRAVASSAGDRLKFATLTKIGHEMNIQGGQVCMRKQKNKCFDRVIVIVREDPARAIVSVIAGQRRDVRPAPGWRPLRRLQDASHGLRGGSRHRRGRATYSEGDRRSTAAEGSRGRAR